MFFSEAQNNLSICYSFSATSMHAKSLLLCIKNCQGNLLSVANNSIITELGMPEKVTKQFAHLSVLIDLIHSLHHNQEIKERRFLLQNESRKPLSIMTEMVFILHSLMDASSSFKMLEDSFSKIKTFRHGEKLV